MRRHATLFLLFLSAVLLAADAGQTAVNSNGKQQPMFTSKEIAASRIRQNAQAEILGRSKLERGRSPVSPQSPLSGGSGVASPVATGSRLSPDLSRQPVRRPAPYLQEPPPPRGGGKTDVVTSPNERKPSCASLCQTVYEQPARPVCIFDSVLADYVPLRNTAHIACYKCLNPSSRIDVRPNTSDCDARNSRNKRNVGQ